MRYQKPIKRGREFRNIEDSTTLLKMNSEITAHFQKSFTIAKGGNFIKQILKKEFSDYLWLC